MDSHESFHLEVEQPARIRRNTVRSYLRSIFTFDELPSERHHRPVFIVCMTVLHVFIHLTIYIGALWHGSQFSRSFTNLWMLFVPCMKPSSVDTRRHNVECAPWNDNSTCVYDDVLRRTCSSFLYPHQLWRMITVNLLHANALHLFFNMLKQLLYGIPLERRYGTVRVVLLYWLSNFGAGLAVMTVHAHTSGIGASGALYGVLVFLVVERLMAMKRQTGRRLLILVQLVVLVVVPMAFTVSLVNFLRYRVGHSAHFGGGVVGFFLAIGMFGAPWPWNDERYQCQTICRCIAFAVLAVYYLLTITFFLLTDAPFISWIAFLP